MAEQHAMISKVGAGDDMPGSVFALH